MERRDVIELVPEEAFREPFHSNCNVVAIVNCHPEHIYLRILVIRLHWFLPTQLPWHASNAWGWSQTGDDAWQAGLITITGRGLKGNESDCHKVVAMEEEMMVSPAFIKKTAGVRGEEDDETGELNRLSWALLSAWDVSQNLGPFSDHFGTLL